MRIFSVVGVSLSGKTTTVEALIRELTGRGYSVGSVKEIHFEQFAMDTPGSNTLRHRQAGSRLVTARGFYETDILYQRKLSMAEILRHYDHDFVALEGVSDIVVPTILCGHNEQEIEERLSPQVFAVSGRVAADKEQVCHLPAFSVLDNAAALTDLVEEYAALWIAEPEGSE